MVRIRQCLAFGLVSLCASALPAAVSTPNRADNPELDGGLTQWQSTAMVTWVADDHDGCAGSGIARLGSDLETSIGISQVIPWPDASQPTAGTLWYRIPAPPSPLDGSDEGAARAFGDNSGLLTGSFTYYDAANCSGTPLGSLSVPLAITEYTGWEQMQVYSGTLPPAATSCVRFSASWYWLGGAIQTAEIDGFVVVPGRVPIFLDGFEGGVGSQSCRWNDSALVLEP